ncbi:MAG TPA: hypothetical protein ENI23_16135 [bacterium]|nr:hypothetical protein [bacterium]
MKLIESNPALAQLSTEKLLDSIDFGKTVVPNLTEIYNYYDEHLPLWRVLNYCGVEEVDENSDAIQVTCTLYSHGTADHHKSARYYSHDRETGAAVGAVYCFKCDKVHRAGSYLYTFLKTYQGKNIFDFFFILENQFQVPFPRQILLDFDADEYYTFENEKRIKSTARFGIAANLKLVKAPTIEYRAALLAMLTGREVILP